MAKKADILARRINRFLRLQASMKPKYKQMDALLELILRDVPRCRTCKAPKGGYQAGAGVLVDNYATENKVFRSHGISRYEVKQVSASA